MRQQDLAMLQHRGDMQNEKSSNRALHKIEEIIS
jgi:hypothetical protein